MDSPTATHPGSGVRTRIGHQYGAPGDKGPAHAADYGRWREDRAGARILRERHTRCR